MLIRAKTRSMILDPWSLILWVLTCRPPGPTSRLHPWSLILDPGSLILDPCPWSSILVFDTWSLLLWVLTCWPSGPTSPTRRVVQGPSPPPSGGWPISVSHIKKTVLKARYILNKIKTCEPKTNLKYIKLVSTNVGHQRGGALVCFCLYLFLIAVRFPGFGV